MTVRVASLAGFCFGVKRAVEYLEGLLENKKSGDCFYTLGELIHNRSVVKDLEARGASAISAEDAPRLAASAMAGKEVHIVIRAHGIEKPLFDSLSKIAAENPFFHLHDMTSPFVEKIHRFAKTCFTSY